jgi:hypothetical protein
MENLFDLELMKFGKLSNALLLTFQAMAIVLLLGVRDPTV